MGPFVDSPSCFEKVSLNSQIENEEFAHKKKKIFLYFFRKETNQDLFCITNYMQRNLLYNNLIVLKISVSFFEFDINIDFSIENKIEFDRYFSFFEDEFSIIYFYFLINQNFVDNLIDLQNKKYFQVLIKQNFFQLLKKLKMIQQNLQNHSMNVLNKTNFYFFLSQTYF
eukprot:TRINITY_DN130_c1_g1_i1.p6 TRINITY_DN130_c1_g1~~TRINITY_DN130_c1_g1_i1.p6  ORF type:complete len:169 (-),score=8.18 TRINITY_DN130_c1_g1_i1:456-962(-)